MTSVQDRVKGFKQGLAAGCPGAHVVVDIDGGGERAKASAAMEDILQAHKDLKGVFGINDDSALGAATAVSAAGLNGKVIVVGYDATPEARTAIKNGRCTATRFSIRIRSERRRSRRSPIISPAKSRRRSIAWRSVPTRKPVRSNQLDDSPAPLLG